MKDGLKTFDRSDFWKPNPYFSSIPDDLFFYIYNLYCHAGGYVKIWSGTNRKGTFYSVDTLLDRTFLSNILCSHRFRDSDNIYMSISTYRTDKTARENNLLNTCAVTVDCDLFKQSTVGMSYLSQQDFDFILNHITSMVQHGLIPLPTYIEYGKNLRMVYLIEPFGIPKTGKKHKDCTTLLKRIFKVLCEKVNSYKGFPFCADSTPRLTSFVRIPYSFTKKDYGEFVWDEAGDRHWAPKVYRYPIRIMMLGDRYSIQELIDAVLPELPEWYASWKKQQKTKKEKRTYQWHSLKQVMLKRMDDLTELQKRGWCIGYRQVMCHLYFQSALSAGYVQEDATDLTFRFNSQFMYPLLEREVRINCCRTHHHYKYTDNRIRELLDCSAESDLFCGLNLPNAERCKQYYARKRQEKINNGDTKAQKMEKMAGIVEQRRSEGKSWAEIGKELGVGVSTAKRYLKRFSSAPS